MVSYLESLEVFFAPTTLPRDIWRHLEGSIARNLREKHPDQAAFYPPDNRTGSKKANLGIRVQVTSDQPICGLDKLIDV